MRLLKRREDPDPTVPGRDMLVTSGGRHDMCHESSVSYGRLSSLDTTSPVPNSIIEPAWPVAVHGKDFSGDQEVSLVTRAES